MILAKFNVSRQTLVNGSRLISANFSLIKLKSKSALCATKTLPEIKSRIVSMACSKGKASSNISFVIFVLLTIKAGSLTGGLINNCNLSSVIRLFSTITAPNSMI